VCVAALTVDELCDVAVSCDKDAKVQQLVRVVRGFHCCGGELGTSRE